MIESMNDSELSTQIELHRTRMALFETQARAASAEIQLARAAAGEVHPILQAMLAEQKKRAEAPKDPAPPADPK